MSTGFQKISGLLSWGLISVISLMSVTFVTPSAAAATPVQIVTTIPDLAWAAREIGKDFVAVRSLLKGVEDPHYADAVPEFIRLVSNADIVCSVGLDLEVGWLPKVLSRSGNAQVQPNGKGHCELGKAVDVLDKPSGAVDRSMGDVHPMGNPHFWLSPKALAKGASQILEALLRADPEHAAAYQKNYSEFSKRMDALVEAGRKKLAPYLSKQAGPQVLEYHREFTYFLDAYGLKAFGSIEEKPGVPPSAGRIAGIAASAKFAGVRLILATDYNPRKTVERVAEISGIPSLIVQASVQTGGRFKDYISLQEHAVDSIAGLLDSSKARQ